MQTASIIWYHLYRVQKHAQNAIHCFWIHAHTSVIEPCLPVSSRQLEESHVLNCIPLQQSLRPGVECKAFIKGWSQGVGVKEQGEGDKKGEETKKGCVIAVMALGKRTQPHFLELPVLRAFIQGSDPWVDGFPGGANSPIHLWCAHEGWVHSWGFAGKLWSKEIESWVLEVGDCQDDWRLKAKGVLRACDMLHQSHLF